MAIATITCIVLFMASATLSAPTQSENDITPRVNDITPRVNAPTQPEYVTETRVDVRDLPTEETTCNYTGLADVVFIIDIPENFHAIQHFRDYTNGAIQRLEETKAIIQIAIITTERDTHTHMNLTSDRHVINKALSRIERRTRVSNMAGAILHATKILIKGSRSTSSAFIFIVTGNSLRDPINALKYADYAQCLGFQIFTVAVGSKTNSSQLSELSSAQKYFFVENYRHLEQYSRRVPQLICDAAKGFEVTSCGSGRPAEVVFVLGSETDKDKESYNYFIHEVIGRLTINEHSARVAIVRNLAVNPSLPRLSSNITEIKEGISGHIERDTSLDFTTRGLDQAHAIIKHSGRAKAGHYIVLLLNGDYLTKNETFLAAERAKQDGVTIIVLEVGHNLARDDVKQLSSRDIYFRALDISHLDDYLTVIVNSICTGITVQYLNDGTHTCNNFLEPNEQALQQEEPLTKPEPVARVKAPYYQTVFHTNNERPRYKWFRHGD